MTPLASAAEPSPGSSEVDPKAAHIQAVTDWLASRRERATDYMTPAEIGASESRPLILLQALAVGIASIYREALLSAASGEDAEEQARGALYMAGVLVVDTYLANGEAGCSTATAQRVAAMLGCSSNSVLRARSLLVRHRLLAGGRKDGHGDRYWPVVSRRLAADPMASVAWLLDATSAAIKRGRRPRAGPASTGTASGPSGPAHDARKSAAAAPSATVEQWDAFWQAYPRQDGRVAAQRAFMKLTQGEAELAVAGARTYARERRGKDATYTMMPRNWLSERRFSDHATNGGAPAASAADVPDGWWQKSGLLEHVRDGDWRALVARYGTPWDERKLGPPPGSPDCIVPAAVLGDPAQGEAHR